MWLLVLVAIFITISWFVLSNRTVFVLGHPPANFSHHWKDELVTKSLGVSAEISGTLFNQHPKYTITAYKNGKVVGYSAACPFNQYYNQLMDTSTVYLASKSLSDGDRTFLIVQRKLLDRTLQYLKNHNINLDNVIHRSGMLINPEFRGKGYAEILLRQHHKMFIGKVVVSNANNHKIASVMSKSGKKIGFEIVANNEITQWIFRP